MNAEKKFRILIFLVWFLFYFCSPILADNLPVGSAEYAPNEIIVKFHEPIAGTIEKQLKFNSSTNTLKLSSNLNELNAKYRVKKIKPLFRNFTKQKQRLEAMLKKDKALLTKKEKHILRRYKRAPKDIKVPNLGRIYKIEVEAGQSLQEIVIAYNNDPGVEYAELNHIVSVCVVPNDPLFPIQWPLKNIGQQYPPQNNSGTPGCDIDAAAAWDLQTGSMETIVAVIDTGVDYSHRDLAGNMWTDPNGCYGYDYVNDDNDPMDDHGHGTHCAGIIAADSNNGLDISGICWNTKIMTLKFLNAEGYGTISGAVKAFYYAVENGADIMSNSWGGNVLSDSLEDAIDYAHSQGVIMVAALGNDGWQYPLVPAYYDKVIGVAATDSKDKKAYFSNYGDWCAIAAPGVDILSLRANGTSLGTTYDNYTTVASGTSMACPHISGVLALMVSGYPESSAQYLVERLYQTADDISGENPGFEGQLGAGRVNAYQAIAQNAFTGSVTLDSDVYSCSDAVTVEVRDLDLIEQESLSVMITTDAGDLETMMMSKDSNQPWVFTNTIPTSSGTAIPEDNTLQVLHDQIIVATYEDANDGTGNPAVAEVAATTDCQSPVISDIEMSNITSTGARVIFRTNEPTTGLVRYGQVCGGPNTIVEDNTVFTMYHNLYLSELTCEIPYFFEIDATDSVGNEITDCNGSQCYTFTTGPIPPGLHVPSEYATIQEAIEAAVDGNTVWVADGTYTGSGYRDIDFKGKAITVRSENGPENCIIDVNGVPEWEAEKHRGFYFHEAEDANSVLMGFTIINGAIPGDITWTGIPWPQDPWHQDPNHTIGGGIYCELASPTIMDCVIKSCWAQLGGGIGCVGGESVIVNCTIDDCWSGHLGMCESGGFGGGIGLMRRCNAKIIGCTIENNMGYWNAAGGGVFCIDSDAEIEGTTICGNSAYAGARVQGGIDGGGIYCEADSNVTLENCVIAQNYAKGGVGIYSNSDCNIVVENSCIAHNKFSIYVNLPNGSIYSKCSDVRIKNSIIWYNDGEQLVLVDPCEYQVTYSDIQDGWAGIGNINIDPLFANTKYYSKGEWINWNYYLKSQAGRWDPANKMWVQDNVTSPCIDAGNPGCPLGDELNDGNNVRINMGAYGGTIEASRSPANWALLADLTNDQNVDFNDLAVFVLHWLDSGQCIPSDLNRSGSINFLDFALFGNEWLWEE